MTCTRAQQTSAQTSVCAPEMLTFFSAVSCVNGGTGCLGGSSLLDILVDLDITSCSNTAAVSLGGSAAVQTPRAEAGPSYRSFCSVNRTCLLTTGSCLTNCSFCGSLRGFLHFTARIRLGGTHAGST